MNIVNLQTDIQQALLSWDALQYINVAQERKMRLDKQIDIASVYSKGRNGRAGIGIIVEMPAFEMRGNKSGPGPQTVLICPVTIIECPGFSQLGLLGCNTDAETVAELVLPFLHQWLIEGQGELYPQDKPIEPARDLPPGTLGYRLNMAMLHSPPFQPRVSAPSATIDGGFLVTLANQSVTATADIWYTLDESFPGSANSAAKKYATPFQSQVGQIVRWAAYKAGYMPSMVTRAVIGS